MNHDRGVSFPSARSALDTPCLLLDLDLLDANLREMQRRARAGGKKLRPHAKSHKCSALARRQIEFGAEGVCVAKLSEAETLLAAGLRGMLVTGPVLVPTKERRLLDCLRQDPTLLLTLDSAAAVRRLDALLRPEGLRADVLLDLDVGLGRTGIPCGAAPALAREIAAQPSLRLRGVQAYAGHIQHLRDPDERRRASRVCLAPAAEIFRALRTGGFAVEIFTAGGTGTHDTDLEIPEITEIQPGSYALMDAEYLAVGTLKNRSRFEGFPPALTLLTSVVSANQRGYVTVDAGLKALYRDGAPPEILRPEGGGYRYEWFGDEYGRVTVSDRASPLRVGDRLELVVSHCDPTVNLFDRYHLVRGERVEGAWAVDLRGCCR
ncbi:MAG: DSD1 family PLP-dependent enzyme [Verrucomicrobiae bacterium]|nr:DSD1 family PLP-dependent enzyme [Verrucomicrobiae bacterium]